jgi:copper chaperone CopZ
VIRLRANKGVGIFLAVLVFFIVSACGTSDQNTAVVTHENLQSVKTTSFKVTGLTCPSCEFVVKSALQRVDGVHNVNVKSEGSTGTAQVDFEESTTTIAKIKQAVIDLGYGVQ